MYRFSSCVLQYATYRIKKDEESFYPFVCNDIMGLSRHGGVHVEDVKMALKGHVKDGYTVRMIFVILLSFISIYGN